MTFTIFQTKTTPYADFKNGCLTIKGKSVPFNRPEIYDTIQDRVSLYMQKPANSMVIDIHLSAVNAVSKRGIFQTFSLFEKMNEAGNQITVNWFYQSDDEDIFELGELCKASFNFIIEMKEEK